MLIFLHCKEISFMLNKCKQLCGLLCAAGSPTRFYWNAACAQHNIHNLSGVIKSNISPGLYHKRKGQLKQPGKGIFRLNYFPQNNIWFILITGKFATKINLKTKFWASAGSLSTVIPSPTHTDHGLYYLIYLTNSKIQDLNNNITQR